VLSLGRIKSDAYPLRVKVRLLLGLGLVLAAAALVFSLTVGSEDAHDSVTSDGSQDATPPEGQGFVSSIDSPRAVVWAVGDGAADSPQAARVAEFLVDSKPDRTLYLGDVYGSGTPEDFQRNYEPTYGALASLTAPTPGNHDAPLADQGYDPYWEEALGAPTPAYYAFRVAGWHILSLNSEIDHDPGSPQLRWLHRRVATGGDCRIAFWHRPRFSAGLDHGDQPDIAPLWNALRGHARIVLNGHEHDMQRLRPRGGITEFVSGAGGASLYDIDESDPRLRFSNDSQYGALRLELRPHQARYSFVTAAGEVLDRGTISCHP
jgi:calcineurin-like phosphoesterase family protein